jgi:hypothetical protein
MRLVVDGIVVTDHARYTLRFVESPKGSSPVLYCDGKRVTKEWVLKINWLQDADKHGGNANTN